MSEDAELSQELKPRNQLRKTPKMSAFILDNENEKEQLDFKVDALLRKKGWEQTSSTPGCLWLWRKQLGKDIFLVNKATAVHIQSWVDEYGLEL